MLKKLFESKSLKSSPSFRWNYKSSWPWVVVGSLFIFCGIMFITLWFLAFVFSQFQLLEHVMTMFPQQPVSGKNILAFGIDNTVGSKRADTIIVMNVNNDRNRLGVVSIPRDTQVKVEGIGLTKINHAYSHGGSELLKKTISSFLNIPIDYYMEVDLSGVSAIVDDIGGVDVTVDKDLFYVDRAGGLTINLKKGTQRLNGAQAMQYLRFRKDSKGDIGRIERQQHFLQMVSKKLTQSGRFLELPMIIKKMTKHIQTDMPTSKMVNLALQFGRVFQEGNVYKETVPGAIMLFDGISYWKPDIVKLDTVIDEALLGFEVQKSQISSRIETLDTVASQDARRRLTMDEVSRVASQMWVDESMFEQLNISVEVLNGFGKPGAARRAAGYLKSLGIKVPAFGNAGGYGYTDTLIVDWKGNLSSVLALSELIQIDPSNVIIYDRPEKPLDFTIVLGQDWIEKYESLTSSL